jgi:homocysteine S-methyltransferase
MSDPAPSLPQLADRVFLMDGGLETSLVFLAGIDLPLFAAFPLLESEGGRAAIRGYFEPYLAIARARRVGFVIDTATWRANPDWGAKLGRSVEDLDRVNRAAVAFASGLRAALGDAPSVVNGVLGPRGDGYRVEARMTADDAARYHDAQIASFAAMGAEMVSAITMNYPEEAIGIARAARARRMPCVISFTVETDGKLPTGDTFGAAVERVEREPAGAPAYYMVNCAHSSHFASALPDGAPWLARLRGVRANASTLSHAELDAATALDRGDPAALGRDYAALRRRFPGLTVLGGCCGTDHAHVAAICDACGF